MGFNQQATSVAVLFSGNTADANSVIVDTAGINGAMILEIAETAGGTATIAIEGTLDATTPGAVANWIGGTFSIGYQQTDNTAAPTRSVTNIAVGASSRHVYQILDPYRAIRLVQTASAGGATITARVYLVPA